MKQKVDRTRLATDSNYRQDVATAIVRHLQVNITMVSSVDEVEAVFTAVILRPPNLRCHRESEGDQRKDGVETLRQKLNLKTYKQRRVLLDSV